MLKLANTLTNQKVWIMKKNKAQTKISKVMKEFKKGELNIGKSPKKVKSKKQAIAIALSQAGKSKKKK